MATKRKSAAATTHEGQRPDMRPFSTEDVALDELRPHPRNYQEHPDDELEHIMASIKEHGVYRNVVVARDGTILAGHGVVEAARKLHLERIPVYRVDYAPDDPRALKLLAGDNEISHLAAVDDRALSELLKELSETADSLLGTGYDEAMLAALTLITRPASEIADLDAAAQWAGMPEYDAEGEQKIQLLVNFASEEDRQEFYRALGLGADNVMSRGATKYIWWPKRRVYDDSRSVRFSERGDDSDT